MGGELEGEREDEDTEEKEQVERRTEKKRKGKAGHLILARGDWCGGAQGPKGQEPAWPRRRRKGPGEGEEGPWEEGPWEERAPLQLCVAPPTDPSLTIHDAHSYFV